MISLYISKLSTHLMPFAFSNDVGVNTDEYNPLLLDYRQSTPRKNITTFDRLTVVKSELLCIGWVE